MSANASASASLQKVVSDVISASREEFLSDGLDAGVLLELQRRWERKLAASAAPPAAAAGAAAAAAPLALPAPPPASAGGGSAKRAATGTASAAASPLPLALLGRPVTAEPAGWLTDEADAGAGAGAGAGAAGQKRKAAGPADDDGLDYDEGADALAGVSDDDDKDPETANVLLTQFDKVSKLKNKWTVKLRNGLLRGAGRDLVFSTATASFVFE